MKRELTWVSLTVFWLFCCLGFAAHAAPVEPRCRGNPGLIGRCYWIRGEFALSADSLFIIDRDDNGRWVIIRNARVHRGFWPVDNALPHNLERAFSRASEVDGAGAAQVRGDYEVCPIPKQDRADTAYACIETASHLRRVPRGWMSPAQKKLHDRAVAEDERFEARAAAADKRRAEEDAARRMEWRLGLPPLGITRR